MFFIWGRKLTKRKLGFVGDFCPSCGTVTTAEVHRVGSAPHLYYIGFGQGQLLGYKRTCVKCKTADWVDLHRYVKVAKSKLNSVQELLRLTFPNIDTVRAERLALEAKAQSEPLRLSQAERDELMRTAFLDQAPKVQARFLETHVDLQVALSLIAVIALAVGVFYLQVTYFPQASNEGTLFTLLGVTLAMLIWQGSQVGRRFMRRKIIPVISAALRPLQPRPEELQAQLTAFRKEGHTIGKKLRLSDLLKALPSDSAVQGGGAAYFGNQQPIVETPTVRKHLNTVFGLLILAAIGAGIWPFLSGPAEMTDYCSTLPLGATYEQVKNQANAEGYRVTALSSGGAYLYSERTMARFGCDLKFAETGLVSASYQLND